MFIRLLRTAGARFRLVLLAATAMVNTRSQAGLGLEMTMSPLTCQIVVTARIRALYGDFSGRSDTRFWPCCLAFDHSWISSRWAGWDPKGQRC